MANFKQKEVTVKGKAYMLQHPGVRNAAKINDRMKNKFGIPQDEKMADEMFAHVVVEPKVKIETFDNYVEMLELVKKAYFFMTGQDDDDDDDEEEKNADQQE